MSLSSPDVVFHIFQSLKIWLKIVLDFIYKCLKASLADFHLLKVIFYWGRLPWWSSSIYQNFENGFELNWIIPTIVTKQVELISCLFTTSPGGRAAGGIRTKANSAQLSWDLGCAWQYIKCSDILLALVETCLSLCWSFYRNFKFELNDTWQLCL